MQNNDKFYEDMNLALVAISNNVGFDISILANASALLWQRLEKINWAGFYLLQNDCLVLGPFQGKIACTRIQVGNGVCGTAVAENRTVIVKNVHEFEGHIACDSASNSEIVVPIRHSGSVYGVLDIDSPVFERFDDKDAAGLESFVQTLEKFLTFEQMGFKF